MDDKFKFYNDTLDINVVVSIPGYLVGLTHETLKSISNIAESLVENTTMSHLTIAITTWDTEWNNVWLEKLKLEIQKYPLLKLRVENHPLDNSDVYTFINNFLDNVGISDRRYLGDFLTKTLLIFYIWKKSVENIGRVVWKTQHQANWSVLHFKATSNLKFIDGNFFYHRLRGDAEFNAKYFSKDSRYNMGCPLDCFTPSRSTDDFIEPKHFLCGFPSLLRIFRNTDKELGDSIAEYFIKNINTQSSSFEKDINFSNFLFYPYDLRFEGGFILKHLISTTTPKVTLSTSRYALDRIHTYSSFSPFIHMENGKFTVKPQDINKELLNSQKQHKLNYIVNVEDNKNIVHSKI